jgi:hypothetical protein
MAEPTVPKRTPRKSAKSTGHHRDRPGQVLAGGTYVIVSLVMLALAGAMAFFMLRNSSALSGDTGDLFYFGTTLILGLSASSFLFGAMRSYARYTGRASLGNIELGGPVVVAALVIAGFFYLRHMSRPFDVLVTVVAVDDAASMRDLVVEGVVKAKVMDDAVKLNRDGNAVLFGLSPSLRGSSTEISVTVPEFREKNPKQRYVLDAGAKIRIEVERNIEDGVPAATLDKIVGSIAAKLGGYTPDKAELRDLSVQIVGLLNLVHPEWTYWRNLKSGLSATFALSPLSIGNIGERCRLVDWRLIKDQAYADIVFSACQKGNQTWEFNITPVEAKPDAAAAQPGASISATSSAQSEAAPSVAIVQFVNKVNEPVIVYWDPKNGALVKYSEIPVAGSYSVQTYAGHTWVIKGASGHEYLVFTPDSSTKIACVEIIPK